MLRLRSTHFIAKGVLLLAAFVLLAIAIVAQPSRRLTDFDQSFYTTIAYDIERHGVFSSGIFDGTDSTRDVPAPGMFFVPGYPVLVLAAMKADSRFGEAVRCSVEANHGLRDEATCEDYALPMHLVHALLLAIAVLAFASAAQLIFSSARVFWLAGTLATASFAAHAALLSFIMTESMTIALYALVMLSALLAWQTSQLRYFVVSGLLLGLLCLTRPSFVVLCPILLVISLLSGMWLTPKPARQVFGAMLAFLLAFVAIVGPWIARNHLSVGKLGLTEEYASAVLIERFAYNYMTPREFIGLFAYCVPAIGDVAFDKESVTGPMHRFLYYAPDSIFHVGRNHRDALLEQHIRLDPIISGIAIEEMRTNWWRHLLVSIPIAWCGMWVGRFWALVTVPLFAAASIRAARKQRPYLLLYAAPALVMLGLHALLANESTRYNLALIGPFSAAAAWLMISTIDRARSRWQAPSPAL